MPVPPVYRTGDQPIVSYDFLDIATGLGFVPYYGAVTKLSGSSLYALLPSAIYSSVISTTVASTTTAFNFDTSVFNEPRTVKGTAYLSIGVDSGGQQTYTVKLQRINADASTNDVSSEINSGVETTKKILLIPIALTETTFGIGTTLRMILTCISNGATTEFGHDPGNRDGTLITPSSAGGETTVMKLYVPFRID